MGDCSDDQVLWNIAADCVERILYESKMVVGPFLSVEMITDSIDCMGIKKEWFESIGPEAYNTLHDHIGELLFDEGFYVVDDAAHSELWDMVSKWADENGIK